MSVAATESNPSARVIIQNKQGGASAGKTLLIVGSIPGSRNVGEILLREMLESVNRERYVVAALLEEFSDHLLEGVQTDSLRVFVRPKEHATRRFHGRLGSLDAALERIRVYERAIVTLAGRVSEFAAENNVNRIWAIFNMTSVIDVCARLVKLQNLPLLAQVWDDVDHLAWQRRLDAVTRRRTAKRFAALLARAERTAVIGEPMSEAYTQRYGARCQIIRHGISNSSVSRDVPTSAEEFIIGFSGGMYCPSAWKALQAALAQLNWQAAGKSIRFVVMSGYVSFKSRSPAQVEYLGWRADSEVLERLSKCDLLYLPQPFEPSQRALAELSFPTKLSAYVSTGRPVLIHGPEYASLVRFSREHRVGPVCTMLDPVAISGFIAELAADDAAYREAARGAATVANTVLSRSNFVNQVRTFLREDSKEEAAT